MSLVVPGLLDHCSLAELTKSVFGSPMTMDQVFDAVGAGPRRGAVESTAARSTWIGSVGYERHRVSTEFASHLRALGVERLVDVRQLPISRRRGYAKSALAEAMGLVGIEYVHMRGLGNPKATRDLYKSGRVEEGRAGYERYLLTEQRSVLEELAARLPEKRTALMCVEHDAGTCHRTVIIDALQRELGMDVTVVELS
jgi:uncharacterized protein (DUF488 family)